ncbi:NADH dehydrogenase [ubiquinone] 1 alpha subcomplex assembly factor 3-like [Ptychodera flava]|uniref:NADH dehydrogenase [ubiquinone] 1 alpha subcomplex assembly factor 3-like n=1 Tax=Ptychodera flava TaxID=63121 RepID=UPI00396A070F
MATSMVIRSAALFTAKITRFRNGIRCMSKMYPTDDELYQKTTVSVIEKDQGGLPFISKYSELGFMISGDKIVGPVAILPKSLVHWNVGSFEDINIASLSLFPIIEPKIEILILGVGSKIQRLDPEVHKFMRSKGIALEIQDTPHACATFNYLVRENRIIAAGLIPPDKVTHY